MNDFETVQECLNIILKKGDLYDTIAEREGVKLQRHSFIRNHILLFSRILYGGVRLVEKVKSHFSPIEEVKNAQDRIRKILGVNVDFVKTKHEFNLYSDISSSNEPFSLSETLLKYRRTRHPILSILYENPNIGIEAYVEHLKKILAFCELHKINEIFLRESDIVGSFTELNLEKYPHTTMKKLLDANYIQFLTEENEIEDEKIRNNYDIDAIFSPLLQLKKRELRELIEQLEVVKVSKQVISSFGRYIEDEPVKKAIGDFFLKGNLGKLKATVSSRLALLINNDSSYKDKSYGKVFQNIVIKDGYINAVSMNSKGEVISNIVTTLYDYLGILDYKTLLKQIKMQGDNREILAMTALQLYLCQSIKIEGLNRKSTSFYDYVYNHYKAKRKGKVKSIPGLYTKSDRRYKSLIHLFSNIIITILLLATILITGASVEFMEEIAFHKEPEDALNNILNTMIRPYLKSIDFEKDFVGKFIDFTEDARVNFSNYLSSFSGDASKGVINNDKVVANVTELLEGYFPTYYATGYAISATYNNGAVEYTIEQPKVDLDELKDLYPVLEINAVLTPEILNQYIQGNEFNIPKLFYPLGSSSEVINYVLTSITIYDDFDSSKLFSINSYNSMSGTSLTDDLVSLLKSMDMPRIVYQYGVNYGMNSFVEDIYKNTPYTENPPDVIRKAITDGLGLEETATDYEIYIAIASKDYSTTPIKDAGLSRKIKKLSEEDYFKTVASMDSLICNLAATLAVGVDEELIYTIGYYNDDAYIRENEKHSWAMSQDGTIIDVTPSSSEEPEEAESFIDKMIIWGLENNIPLYALIAFVGYEVNKIFGKKIRFKVKVDKLAKRLTNPDMEKSYARLREDLYGGINIPCKRLPTELLDAITRDFGGFTVQELEEIRKSLLQGDLDSEEELKPALTILKETPFLREHSDKVKKVLMKKMKK